MMSMAVDGDDLHGDLVPLEDFADLIAAHERRHAVLAITAARLAERGEWARDGHVSMGSWLRDQCRMSRCDANRLLREGRFLVANDIIGEAAVTGMLSAGQVAAVRTMVTAPIAALFHERQLDVIDTVRDLPVAATETACQTWREYAEAIVEMPEPVVPSRSWRSARAGDGTVIGGFVFDPVGAAELEQALRTARRPNGAGDARTPTTRNADAVVEIMSFFNANHTGAGSPRNRPDVTMNLQVDNLDLTPDGPDQPANPHQPGQSHQSGGPDQPANSSEPGGLGQAHQPGQPEAMFTARGFTVDGQLLPDWATEAYLCDCTLQRVLRSGFVVLDYGRKIRTVPTPLWRAVLARDGGCRHPGCDRPGSYCDAHHIRWWRKHGETKLDNLLMLCSYHHHLIHRQNWQITLQPNGDVHFTTPDGRTLISKPRDLPTIRAA